MQSDLINNFIKITCPLFLWSMDRLLLKYSVNFQKTKNQTILQPSFVGWQRKTLSYFSFNASTHFSALRCELYTANTAEPEPDIPAPSALRLYINIVMTKNVICTLTTISSQENVAKDIASLALPLSSMDLRNLRTHYLLYTIN